MKEVVGVAADLQFACSSSVTPFFVRHLARDRRMLARHIILYCGCSKGHSFVSATSKDKWSLK